MDRSSNFKTEDQEEETPPGCEGQAQAGGAGKEEADHAGTDWNAAAARHRDGEEAGQD